MTILAGLPLSVFIGAKGGAGTTTICRELARAMREKHSVALIDADLTGSRSIAVLCEAVRLLDGARTGNAIVTVRTDGLTLFELADRYDAAYTLEEGKVEALIDDLGAFDEIVVDAPQPFAAATRPFMARARRFFIVLEPTLLGVAGAQSMMADLKRFGVPANRIDLVTNSRVEQPAVQRAEIERALEAKLVAEIPPATNRNYAKTIAALQKHIETLPILGGIPTLQPSAGGRAAPSSNGHSAAPAHVIDPKRDAFKQEVHAALVRQLDLVTASQAMGDSAKMADLRSKVENIAAALVSEKKFQGNAEELADLRREIVDEALGWGLSKI